MDYQEIIKKIKPELDKVANYLKGELANIRTSRPSASLLEGIEVELFGKKMPLKSLGLITMSGPQEVVIQPWDISYIPAIEKAISDSPLQVSPVTEKERIRVSFPPLSKEVRESVVRVLSQKTEDARQTVRRWRNEAWKDIQDGFSKGEITEDNKYRGKDKLQEVIDEYNEKIEEMAENKKKEIME